MKYLNYQNLALVAVISGAVFFISAHYIDNQQRKFGDELLQMITAKEAQVLDSAKSAKENKLTPVLATYINDCSTESRQRFDASLDRLVSLPPEDIQALKPLFEACGSYFAKVKTALVSELDQEITELENLTHLAESLGLTNALNVPVTTWREYAKQQESLALALADQYQIQMKINDLLINGVSPTDNQVQNLVKEARLLSESVRTANGLADLLYSEINL